MNLGRWISAELAAAFAAEETTAHRLFSSRDAWVERLGDDVMISHKNEDALPQMLDELVEWEAKQGLEFQRVFSRFLPVQNAERHAPKLARCNAELPLRTVVQEAGLKYGLDFEAGYSVGLFLDQRANRQFLRTAVPRRVLNCFAYTCSFSVAAASAGAETVSIDLSKKSLMRGRENFDLNGLAIEPHRFIADDVMDVLPRLARKNEKFDAIILDPPTFSRGNKGRRWQVESHLDDLIMAALELASPGARVLISTNCTRLSNQVLETAARHSMKVLRRGGRFHRESPLPDIPAELAAQTLWLLLS